MKGLQNLVQITIVITKMERNKNTFIEKAESERAKAYESAKTGDMYQAYLHLDSSIKAKAASVGQNIFANPLFVQMEVMKHWNKLNDLASEAAERDPEAKKRLEDSVIKLENQKSENSRDDENRSGLYMG